MRQTALMAVTLGVTLMCDACKSHPASSLEAAGPAQRKVLGIGAPYDADPRPHEVLDPLLDGSINERRDFGWNVVRKILKPVPVALAPTGAPAPRIPTMLTWYTAAETGQIFKLFYSDLRQRRLRGECGATGSGCDLSALGKAAIEAYSTQASLLPGPSSLYQALAAQLSAGGSPASMIAGGLGKGNQMAPQVTLFNNSVVLHYLTHFEETAACLKRYSTTAPPVLLDPSGTDVFGGCFGASQPFPDDAVSVKTRWSFVGSAATVGEAPTDAAGLLAALSTPAGTWAAASAAAGAPTPLPDSSHIYTVRVQTGGSTHDYALTGVHITTKEVRNWVWVSLWWSSQPTGDFGSDRPDHLCLTPGDSDACAADDELLETFNNYKMCIATTFKEEDPLLAAPIAADAPRAAVLAPLKAIYDQNAGATWCSNQYIELGAKEPQTNCIGCHQYAAPGITFDRSQPSGSPLAVADKRVNKFLADFMWSFSEGDEIAAKLNDFRQDIDATSKP